LVTIRPPSLKDSADTQKCLKSWRLALFERRSAATVLAHRNSRGGQPMTQNMTPNMSPRSTDVNRSGDFFSVQLASGEVKKWTLDQLDAAYRASFIDEETYVLPKGARAWSTLGQVAGAEAPGTEVAECEPPSVAPPPVVADIVIDVDVDLASDDLDIAGLRPRGSRGLVRFAKFAAFAAIAGGLTFVALKNPALVATVRTRATAMIAKPAPFQVSVVPPVAAAPVAAAPAAAAPAASPVAASPSAAAPSAPAPSPSAAAPAAVVTSLPASSVAMTTSGIPVVTAATEKAKPAAAAKPEKAKKKAAPARHKANAHTPFTKTSNAHDPLNGNL
jgi:hypothetical protein